jgi:uncharacterized protein DUF6519
MKGDITRQAFRARNHYRGVLQQQGRVQLDADWNEQVLLQDHLDRLVTEDTIGPHGAPEHAAGMAIAAKDGTPLGGPVAAGRLWISPGHYYVHGILCENEEVVRLEDQPDLPGVRLPGDLGPHIAFLDVWHRLITSAEQPSLREVALGGPDTTTRSKTVWQVKVRPAADSLPPRIGSGRLRARAEASGPVTSPCDAPTGTGFRRLDNQLYRVEIRDPGDPVPGTATFLWSRENGSVTARLLKLTGNDLVLDSIGRDGRLSFDKGWVEVTSPGQVLRGEPGFLGSIGHVQGNTVTVTWDGAQPPDDFDVDGAIVRRWESGALPVRLPADPEVDWIELESGVQIQFRDAGFRTGDYWLIPARTANLEGVAAVPGLAGNVDWPQEGGAPAYQGPEGIWHSYADIAGLDLGGEGWTVTDLRPVFPPITELAAEVEVGYCGGDGQQVLAGEVLPQPLEVSVTRRGKGVPGATVRFQAADPGGRLADSKAALASAAAFLDAIADPDGVARCWWQPASGTPADHLRVTARYVGKDGNLTDPLIEFSAAFAQASDVGFALADCPRLADAHTVQAAIQTLAATSVLVAADGDGQDGTAGTDLPRPVAVQVHTGCDDPVLGAAIRFTVASGAVAPTQAGLAGAGTSTGPNITTDKDGLARCWWHLGDETPVQTLTATLLLAGGAPDPAAEPVTFVAGAVPADGLHVTDVVSTKSGVSRPNDAEISAVDLADGLAVLLDGPPDLATVNDKPVLTVTLDLPYPLSRADRVLWVNRVTGVAGSIPLTLAGKIAADNLGGRPAVTWTPAPSCKALLQGLFGVLADARADDKVLCHLALDARVTGGAGYTQWNWLVDSIMRLVLVPNQRRKLQLSSGREMLAHTLPRDAIRTAVHAGVHINDEPAQDPGTARRAAGNAFRNKADRQLVLVAAQPYAAAARAIADALADAVQVRLEVIATADPAAEASNRIAAGQPVDGVLTDETSAPAITALPDFSEVYPL